MTTNCGEQIYKGWIQTWLVHMRAPRKLLRELKPAGFSVFQLLVGGSVLAALVHPFFLLAFLWQLAADDIAMTHASFYGAVLLLGYLTSITLASVGLARRNLLKFAWALLLMPVYWLLLSLAAWRALDQLVRDPYRWEKTEHGLARNSRLTDESGAAPAGVRNIAAAPPRIVQRSARA